MAGEVKMCPTPTFDTASIGRIVFSNYPYSATDPSSFINRYPKGWQDWFAGSLPFALSVCTGHYLFKALGKGKPAQICKAERSRSHIVSVRVMASPLRHVVVRMLPHDLWVALWSSYYTESLKILTLFDNSWDEGARCSSDRSKLAYPRDSDHKREKGQGSGVPEV